MALKTTAQTKKDVDEMTPQERTWDRLTYAYDKQKEASNASYKKAISQNERSLLNKGLQRSSYGANTTAGLMNSAIKAENDIDSQKIAAYENAMYQIEKDEDEKAYRDKTFAEQVRQFDANLKFQQDEAARAQGNVDREFDANRSDVAWSQKQTELQNEYQKQQDALAQENLLRQEAYQKEQDALAQENLLRQEQIQKEQNAFQNAMAEKTFDAGRADTEWNQQYQQAAFEYQKQQDAFNNALAQSQFDFSKASTEMQYYYNYVITAAANGGDVSDEMLEKVGISRADYNAMKAAAKTGGGGGGAKKTTTPAEDQTDAQHRVAGMEALLDGGLDIAGNRYASATAGNFTATPSGSVFPLSSGVATGLNGTRLKGDDYGGYAPGTVNTKKKKGS